MFMIIYCIMTAVARVHSGDEEYFVLERKLTNLDGRRYRKDNLVWLDANVRHNSYSPEDTLLVVNFR